MSDANPRVLVLGASGTTGIETVRLLTGAGFPVRVTYREQAELNQLRAYAFDDSVVADYNNVDDLKRAMEGIDRLLSIVPVAPQAAEWNANIHEAAQQSGVSHIVRISQIGASDETDAEIAKTHYQADESLKGLSNVNHTIIKPAVYYQNMFWAALTIVRLGNFGLPLGDASLAQIDVRDVARVCAHSLVDDGHEGKEYTITGPESMTMHVVARKISRASGRNIRYLPVPPAAAKQVFKDAGLPEWHANAIGEMYQEYASGRYNFVSEEYALITGERPTKFDQFSEDYRDVFIRETVSFTSR